MNDVGTPSRRIRAIDRGAVHRICSGQVVHTLATAVKELVENSLDARSTNIEVRLKEYGSQLVEVIDDGCGVEAENFEGIGLKYHTSKLQSFEDLADMHTFGFRGEALSSLCALSDVVVVTRHESADNGFRLEYDHRGKLIKQIPCPRQLGTTVGLGNLFSTLPVRRKEFVRNLRREFGKAVQLLTAYSLVCTKIRLLCTNQTANGKKSTVLATQGSLSVRDNVATIFGPKESSELLELDQTPPSADILEEYSLPASASEDNKFFKIEGLVSPCRHGRGRSTPDRQFFYVNGRPCELQKVSRLINDVYHAYNRHQYPLAILNFHLERDAVDINVTPDKRQVFLQNEKLLLATVKASLHKLYSLSPSTLDCSPLLPSHGCTAVPQSGKRSVSDSQDLGASSASGLKRFFSPSPSKTGKRPRSDVFANFRSLSSVEKLTNLEETSKLGHTSSLTVENLIPDEGHEPGDTLQSVEQSEQVSDPLDAIERTGTDNGSDTLHGSGSPADGKARHAAKELVKPDEEGESSYETSAPKFTRVKAKSPSVGHPETSFLPSPPSAKDATSTSDLQGNASPDWLHVRKKCVQLDKRAVRIEPKSYVQNLPGSNSLLDAFRHRSDRQCLPTEKESPKFDCGISASPAVAQSIATVVPETLQDEIELTLDEPRPSPTSASRSSVAVGSPETDDESSLPEPDENRTQIVYDASSRKRRSLVTVCFSLHKLREILKLETAAVAPGKNFNYRRFRARISPDENGAAEEEMRRVISKDMFAEMEIVGQFNLGFVVTKHGPDLFVVDQHATDEKYNFELLQKNTELETQALVVPRPLELTAVDERVLTENAEIFDANGFRFLVDEEAPAGRKIRLKSVPVSRNWTFGKEDVDELIFMLRDSPGTMCRPSRVTQMFASRACRKSVMIGTSLTTSDMRKLVSHMGDIEQPWNCPHGRPTIRHLFNMLLLKEPDSTDMR